LRHESNTQPAPTVEALLRNLEEPFVEVIELDRDVAIQANVLCRRFAANKLYPGDAVHLASALRGLCDVLLCYDRPLISIIGSGVSVEEPAMVSLPFTLPEVGESLKLTPPEE
jgi:hypothetical protein